MELQLDAVEGQAVPPDTFVSVRIGNVHKQTRFVSSRTHSFPKSAANEGLGRIEIFKRIGSGVISFDGGPHELKEIQIPCEYPGLPEICWRVSTKRGGAGVADPEERKRRLQARVDSAQQYLAEHHLDALLVSLTHEVLRERPKDPRTFLTSQIMRQADVHAWPISEAEEPVPKAPLERLSPAPHVSLPPIDHKRLSEVALHRCGSAPNTSNACHSMTEELPGRPLSGCRSTSKASLQPINREVLSEAAQRSVPWLHQEVTHTSAPSKLQPEAQNHKAPPLAKRPTSSSAPILPAKPSNVRQFVDHAQVQMQDSKTCPPSSPAAEALELRSEPSQTVKPDAARQQEQESTELEMLQAAMEPCSTVEPHEHTETETTKNPPSEDVLPGSSLVAQPSSSQEHQGGTLPALLNDTATNRENVTTQNPTIDAPDISPAMHPKASNEAAFQSSSPDAPNVPPACYSNTLDEMTCQKPGDSAPSVSPAIHPEATNEAAFRRPPLDAQNMSQESYSSTVDEVTFQDPAENAPSISPATQSRIAEEHLNAAEQGDHVKAASSSGLSQQEEVSPAQQEAPPSPSPPRTLPKSVSIREPPEDEQEQQEQNEKSIPEPVPESHQDESPLEASPDKAHWSRPRAKSDPPVHHHNSIEVEDGNELGLSEESEQVFMEAVKNAEGAPPPTLPFLDSKGFLHSQRKASPAFLNRSKTAPMSLGAVKDTKPCLQGSFVAKTPSDPDMDELDLSMRPMSVFPPQRGRIKVTIKKAFYLRNADFLSESDPYCILQVHGREPKTFRTKVIDDNLNPVWDQSYDFDYMPGDPLHFQVYDKDMLRDDFLGEVTLKSESFWPQGFNKTGEVVLTLHDPHKKSTQRDAKLVVSIDVLG